MNVLARPSKFEYFIYPLGEQAMKARKEIADYIKTHRLERARVRVRTNTAWNYTHCTLATVLYCLVSATPLYFY